MTAEEFLKLKNYPSFNNNGGLGIGYCHQIMIEFAKYHVEQALKAASEKGCMEVENYKGKHLSIEEALDNYTDCRVNKDSILNSYSLTNIK